MNETRLESFSYLWTTERNDWILVETPRTVVPVIFNRSNRQALLIDDDGLHAAVVEKMQDAGIGVFDGIPSESTDVESPRGD
ncbi:hypothetical protein ACFVJW_22980 [Streptomyces libani]|uniref:hypothetical protein n=1 Tax=Streptomyces nigrescens TaxID=1920 RepID=UPI00224EAE9D|nr:hypothetical protein [Streptomyces libani]MCX5450972.1 hypothetical protein [Streptomyces libani]